MHHHKIPVNAGCRSCSLKVKRNVATSTLGLDNVSGMVISANRIQASVLWFVARPTNRGESVAKIRDEEMPEALSASGTPIIDDVMTAVSISWWLVVETK